MRILALTLATSLCLLAAAPALAQSASEKEAIALQEAQEKAKRAEAEKEARAKAPPPAIPGAEFSGDVAPATKNPAAMSPNDALFDAINRGDGPAARDAMSRGAQLDAKNVLGQTPLDAAIEANRNDITFLLLSLRGAAGSGAQRPRLASAQVPVAVHGGAHGAAAVKTAAVAPPARTVSADRGTPNPAVGFTGF